MKMTKYRMEDRQLYDFKGVEKHLADMAAKGWRLERAGRHIWKYRRAEPAKVRYAVTYSLDASEFNPGPTKGQESLEDLCAAAGWQKVSDWNQMQIFSSEAENPIPLETDEALRVQVIDQVMWKSYLPLTSLIIVIGIIMCLGPVIDLIWHPVKYFESWTNSVILASWFLILFFCAGNVLLYCLWHRKSLKSTAHGGPCAEVGPYRKLNALFLVLMYALLLYLVLKLLEQGETGVILYVLVYAAFYVLVLFLLDRVRRLLQRMQFSRKTNIVVSVIAAVVLFGAVNFGTSFGLISHLRGVREAEAEEIPLPLTLEELNGVSYEEVEQGSFPLGNGSFLLTRNFYYEEGIRMTPDGRRLEEYLQYEILDIKTGWLYQKELEDRQEPKQYHSGAMAVWTPVDAAPWGAEQVYHFHLDGQATTSYLLCWPGRLVDLDLGTQPTAEQMAAAGRELAPAQ